MTFRSPEPEESPAPGAGGPSHRSHSVRRSPLWGAALLVLAVALGVAWWVSARRPPDRAWAGRGTTRPIHRPERASVLLVTMDTTRPDHLEPYGGPQGATPNLVKLAETGVVFDHAYSVAPITLVAHSSIHTGLYPPQHGVRNNGIHSLRPEVETLAERLHEAGLRTAAFVSAAVLEKRYGLDQGFEVYDDDLSTGRERHPRMVPDRPAEATVKAASAWLDGLKDDERFFLWVHFYDPHAPYSPPPPYRDEYRDDLYQGEIAYLDSWIGKLLGQPQLRQGNVVTVIVGDHGESLGEHGEQTHALLAYDSTLHVPLLMRWRGGPARRARGARRSPRSTWCRRCSTCSACGPDREPSASPAGACCRSSPAGRPALAGSTRRPICRSTPTAGPSSGSGARGRPSTSRRRRPSSTT